MSYKYKLNFYEIRDLKLFPRVLTEFISSVVTAMESNNFAIYVDLDRSKAIIESDSDFEDAISKFETNGLDYEYYEDEESKKVTSECEEDESMCVLNTSALTSNKLIISVIKDLIESAEHLIVKGRDDYYNYYSYLSSIVIDMIRSKIVVKSDYSLYDSMKSFNNNGLPYTYYSTLSYELDYWENELNDKLI